MDFSSLYTNVQKAHTPHLRAFKRKIKIKKIFNLDVKLMSDCPNTHE